jgi:flagellar basal-body rod protein FlgG
MDRGTYAAASAGLMQLRKLEVVTNNLANVNTPGFKRQGLQGAVQTFDQTLAGVVDQNDPFARGDHARVPGVVNVNSVTDFSAGSIRATGNPLDVALRNGNDFFVVQTPAGTRYSRAGNFTLGPGGILTTMDGLEVQGDGGPITVTEGKVEIGPDGGVLVDGVAAGRLRVVRFEDTRGLERVGANLFDQGRAAAPADTDPDVVPQSLEMANVSVISAVVDLMTANRGFQMYTKSAETIDTMNQSAINQYGRRVR